MVCAVCFSIFLFIRNVWSEWGNCMLLNIAEHCYDIKYAHCLKDSWIFTLVTLCTCSHMMHAYCTFFLNFLHLYFVTFHYCTRVPNKHIINIRALSIKGLYVFWMTPCVYNVYTWGDTKRVIMVVSMSTYFVTYCVSASSWRQEYVFIVMLLNSLRPSDAYMRQ